MCVCALRCVRARARPPHGVRSSGTGSAPQTTDDRAPITRYFNTGCPYEERSRLTFFSSLSRVPCPITGGSSKFQTGRMSLIKDGLANATAYTLHFLKITSHASGAPMTPDLALCQKKPLDLLFLGYMYAYNTPRRAMTESERPFGDRRRSWTIVRWGGDSSVVSVNTRLRSRMHSKCTAGARHTSQHAATLARLHLKRVARGPGTRP